MPPLQICTLITKNRLAYARVLAESLARHAPGARLTVLIVDEVEGRFAPADEAFDLLELGELGAPRVDEMALRYSAFEFAVAFKPRLIAHLLERHDRVLYLDADTRVYAPLTPLADALEHHPVVLVPHLLRPVPDDGETPDERSILVAGAYNTGCVALRRDATSSALLDWWAARLRTGSRVSPAEGMMVDQRWLDLAPGLFERTHLLRDPGVDAAYWTLPAHPYADDGASPTVGGSPLRLFHFSGFDPDDPARLSAYDTRYVGLDRDAPLGALCHDYARALRAAGVDASRRWPYSWDRTASGIALDLDLRRLLDPGDGDAPAGSPFETEGERRWIEWWNGPAATGGEHCVTRFLARLHAGRADLQARFPDLETEDGARFRHWAFEFGRHEVPIPDRLLPLVPFAGDSATGAGGERSGLVELEPGDRLEARRGDTVVAIPVYGARDLFVRCLRSLLRHTPAHVTLLVVDDASPDPGCHRFLVELEASGTLHHRVAYLRHPENVGFVRNVNAAFAVADPADVVVLNSDCMVGPGWLEAMQLAAYADSNVATASALTNHGTILSIPHRNRPARDLPQDVDFDQVAAEVRRSALDLRPRIPTAVGHCMLVRRDALDLVGGFDDAFSPGYGEEVDFSQRCVLHGLTHVAADAALVLHRQGGTFGEDGLPSPIQAAHERIIDQRYRYYDRTQQAFQTADSGPLPRALRVARRAVRGRTTVTVDARVLGPFMTGTQVHALELVAALHRSPAIDLRVVVPPDLGGYARAAFATLPGIELLPFSEVGPGTERTDVVHRPFQVSSSDDLELLRRLGERLVITHQDLIAYRNPGYFPAFPQWQDHRRLTRLAMAVADRVVFFSEHAARDAAAEDLVDAERSAVVHIGVDHGQLVAAPPPAAPAGGEGLPATPFLLCLGTDFRHKNRLFALRLLDALVRRHDWPGKLVLAGPRVADGSSLGDEDAYLALRPALAERVVRLPAVGDAEKAWLYEHAAASVYPTLYEGFGLMPFEAADHDRPCLLAWTSSLQEVVPRSAATLVPWDADASADRVIRVLTDPGERRRLVELVRAAGERFRWAETAERLTAVYRQATEAPSREAASLAWDALAVERERDALKRKYDELWLAVGDDGRDLLRPEGPLSPEHQRSLRAVVNRPALRRPLLGALRAGYVAGRRLSGKDGDASAPATSEARAAAFLAHFGHSNDHHMAEQLRATDPLVRSPLVE